MLHRAIGCVTGERGSTKRTTSKMLPQSTTPNALVHMPQFSQLRIPTSNEDRNKHVSVTGSVLVHPRSQRVHNYILVNKRSSAEWTPGTMDTTAQLQEYNHPAYRVVLAIVRDDHVALVRALHDGANDDDIVNARVAPKGLNWTPLFFACFAGRTDMVQQLLQRGSQPNLVATRQDTPLHLAVEGQHMDVAKLLLQWGADPVAKNGDGVSPFGLILIMNRNRLSAEHRLQWARLFLHVARVDPNAECRHGMNFLHQACALGYSNLTRELVEQAGGDICAPEARYQYTPLMLALANRHDDIVDYLIHIYCQRLRAQYRDQALHTLLVQHVEYVEDGSGHDFVASLPIGSVNVEQFYSICANLIQTTPSCVRQRNPQGVLPLTVACQTNAPHAIIDLLLCHYPDALLFECA